MLNRLLDAQYRHPSGLLARWIGRKMMEQHRPENLWTVSLLDVHPSDHILEVGFGPGVAIGEAARRASQGRVCGIDSSRAMVRMARKHNAAGVRAGRVELRYGDAATLPFVDGSFDKAFSIHSIYFWPRPLDALRELQRVLKPGGLVALTILPREHWPGGGIETPTCRPYSAKELRSLLASAGFTETWIQADEQGTCPSTLTVLGRA